MKIDFLTLFPEMIKSCFETSIIGRGIEAGHIETAYYQIRDYSKDKHRRVDDYPYGGGPGLLMTYQPIYDAYKAARGDREDSYCIYMSPKGKVLNNAKAMELSKKDHIIILCGHYEGVDERIIDEIVDEEISIGDYVLTGGELPAMILADAIARFVPGVLSSCEGFLDESHVNYLLEHPQYTRPYEINGRSVPDILLSGHHGEVEKWKLEKSIKITKERRPDLYELYLKEKEKD